MQKAKQLGNAAEAERHATICDKLEDTEDDAKEAYVMFFLGGPSFLPSCVCVCVCMYVCVCVWSAPLRRAL
jgi:hypothetical protein